MKSFRILSFVAAIGASLLAVAVSAYDSVRAGLFSFAAEALRVVAPEAVKDPVPQVRKAQAKAFQYRIEKRERPVITSSWRMCPSV